MKVTVFSSKPYDRQFLDAANAGQHQLVYLESKLDAASVISASGSEAVCAFVNDHLNAEILHQLASQGTKLVALRCAGFNHVDLAAAANMGLFYTRKGDRWWQFQELISLLRRYRILR